MRERTRNRKGNDMLTELAPGSGLLDPSAASLARELAQAIRPVESVLPDYGFSGLNDPLWIDFSATPEFKRMLEEAQREWNAADTTKRRIQMKAQTSVEMFLPELHRIVVDPVADRADRINAAKLMKSFAGMDVPAGGPGMGGEGGGGVTVKIIIGSQTVTKDVARGPIIEHEALTESPDA
jgi:hypothetical protein